MAVRVCRVALTGGVASGKSTVARMLAERGAAVCDADRIVHELYRSGGQGAAVVGRLFGSGVLAADGSVDTVALGELVLADPRALARLNAAVHPLVRTRLQGWLAELKGSNIAVVEAALVMEAGTAGDYNSSSGPALAAWRQTVPMPCWRRRCRSTRSAGSPMWSSTTQAPKAISMARSTGPGGRSGGSAGSG
jgi:hypothetical protein